MKKLGVFSPVDSSLVTILQDVNCATGSKVINDEFHDLLISINGKLIGPLGPGEYSLDPRFSPFFTRLRTIPTGGKLPINVSVFYISKKNYSMQWGTGEIACNEKILNIPLPVRIAVGGTMLFKVVDSKFFLKSLVGLQGFNVEDLDTSTHALIIPEIRDAIISRMTAESFTGAQVNLMTISSLSAVTLSSALEEFGLELTKFAIVCFNINGEDFAKFQRIHEQRVAKATEIEANANEIAAIYGGNVYDKARVEALINFSKNNGMSGSMAQMAMLPAIWTMGGKLSEEMNGMFNLGNRNPHSSDVTYPSCHATINGIFHFCPHCGHTIN